MDVGLHQRQEEPQIRVGLRRVCPGNELRVVGEAVMVRVGKDRAAGRDVSEEMQFPEIRHAVGVLIGEGVVAGEQQQTAWGEEVRLRRWRYVIGHGIPRDDITSRGQVIEVGRVTLSDAADRADQKQPSLGKVVGDLRLPGWQIIHGH